MGLRTWIFKLSIVRWRAGHVGICCSAPNIFTTEGRPRALRGRAAVVEKKKKRKRKEEEEKTTS
jgi:hypothetical protein